MNQMTSTTRTFVGRLEWIGVAAARRGEIQAVDSAKLEANKGIVGEHHSGSKKRQVTLIQKEHLPVIAQLLGVEEVDQKELRRNLLVSGINLKSLEGREFSIGSARLRGTGDCAPCGLMDENLGPGGHDAMVGHGGLTAVVLEGGTINVGDTVQEQHAQ